MECKLQFLIQTSMNTITWARYMYCYMYTYTVFVYTMYIVVTVSLIPKATDDLRRSAQDAQLGSTVKSVASLMERMTAALRYHLIV